MITTVSLVLCLPSSSAAWRALSASGPCPRCCERLTQVRHVPLDDLVCVRWWLLTPDLTDEAVGGNGLAAVQKQHSQQCPLLGGTQCYLAVVIDNFKRPQNAELEHPCSPRRNATTARRAPQNRLSPRVYRF